MMGTTITINSARISRGLSHKGNSMFINMTGAVLLRLDQMRIKLSGKCMMIETNSGSGGEQAGEQGMALVGVMLIMSLMVMLALAVSFTALSDNSITSNFKNTTKGFYAAE